jgi:spore maturation protein CgeB
MNDIFNRNEIIFYSDINDLSDKIRFYSKNENLRKKIAQQGKKKYFQLFNDVRVSKYILDISLGVNAKLI